MNKEHRQGPRKDVRARYTESMLQEALLKLLETHSYKEMTVSKVCEEAGVHRTTFYAHYAGLDDLVRQIVDEASAQIGEAFEQFPRCADEGSRKMPLCQMIRENGKYRSLFKDPDLFDYFVARSSVHFKDAFTRRVSASLGVNRQIAEQLFIFQTYGCTAVAVRSIGMPDEEWRATKAALDSVLHRGLCITSPTD